MLQDSFSYSLKLLVIRCSICLVMTFRKTNLFLVVFIHEACTDYI